METLQNFKIEDFKTVSGYKSTLTLTYQIFGRPLHTAPIVMINHALTGNSNVSGKDGWWKTLVGPSKCVDTNNYTVLTFNLPGNGYGKDNQFIENPYVFNAYDVAKLLLIGLERLQIDKLFALLGASIGGGLAWEMIAQNPNITQHLIPIATDWKATDWVIAQCHIQNEILQHSSNPLSDARMHAMTMYRTPESFTYKFNRTKHNEKLFNIQSWLNHHGKTLKNRFTKEAYIFLNHIMHTIDITRNDDDFNSVLLKFKGHVHLVSVNTDLLYKPKEIKATHQLLSDNHKKSTYHEIKSIHGHDAFLIEYEQLNRMLGSIF